MFKSKKINLTMYSRSQLTRPYFTDLFLVDCTIFKKSLGHPFKECAIHYPTLSIASLLEQYTEEAKTTSQ